jgi:predicted CopG family antitoxin
MAVKTITIDVEAYEVLAREKKKGQSFSQVFKEHFRRPRTARDLLAAARATRIADETLDAIEDEIRRRAEDPARLPSL